MAYTLSELLDRLDEYTVQIPIDDLRDLVETLEDDWEVFRPYLRFQNRRYNRNLIRAGESYHALLLCWKNGQRSPIHDHRESRCAFRVMKGVATETIFATSDNGLVYPTTSRELVKGSIGLSEDDDKHQISNLQAEGELVTLHLYSPPLIVMGKYSLTTGTVTDFTDPVFEFSHGTGI